MEPPGPLPATTPVSAANSVAARTERRRRRSRLWWLRGAWAGDLDAATALPPVTPAASGSAGAGAL